MNRAISRAINARTTIITPRQVIVSAKNGPDFPKLADNVAARVLLQDVCKASPHYSKTISQEMMK